jgi:hypothetical protein
MEVAAVPAGKRTDIAAETAFDLNIGKVLEHWTVPFALREVIANALDEQALTGTSEPAIYKAPDGSWRIADGGRGLRYEHLTQNESAEKRRHPDVIGQFGMGLKDALAVFDRRGVEVVIVSPHGDIAPDRRPKENFADIVTLHAIVRPPAEPGRTGTEVVLRGVTDEDINQAKAFFLRYSDEQVLESTKYGQVLAPPPKGRSAHVYVKGLLVAKEENFLFSYNISNLSAALRRALNRERTNVGRAAYSDRVKSILKECTTSAVAGPLTKDLGAFTTGRQHDELGWLDVSLHACRVLATNEKVVFVTTWQYGSSSPQLQYARDEGYRLVVVPDVIAQKLGALKDMEGKPLLDFAGYGQAWNDGFQFTFIEPGSLTPEEQRIFGLTKPACRLIGADLDKLNIDVLVSETMRLNDGGSSVLGVWEGLNNRVVVRRDQLAKAATYCGTLLHEVSHALSKAPDNSLDFEDELTRAMGHMAAVALKTEPGPTSAPKSRAPGRAASQLSEAQSERMAIPSRFPCWDAFVEQTTADERRRWCAAKANTANRERLMSGKPQSRITSDEVWTLLEAAKGRCAYCGSLAVEHRPSRPNGGPAPWAHVGRRIGSLSHIVAPFQGGTNTMDNLRWCCLWCTTWPVERRLGATDHGGIAPTSAPG